MERARPSFRFVLLDLEYGDRLDSRGVGEEKLHPDLHSNAIVDVAFAETEKILNVLGCVEEVSH